MRGKNKQILMIIGVVIVVAILIYLVDMRTVFALMRAVDPVLISYSMGFMVLSFILVAVRLRFFLGEKISLRQTFYGDALGFMLTHFLPLPTPLLRALAVERTTPLNGSQVSPAMAVDYLLSIVSRFISIFFLIFLIPTALDSAWSLVGSILMVTALLGGLVWLVNHLDQAFTVLARWLGSMPRMNEEQVHQTLKNVREGLETAGSTRGLLVGLFYSLGILLFFTLYHYLAWAALPLNLSWRQMLILSMAALVVLPPTSPLMIGVYQVTLVGALALFRIVNINTLTAYALLVHGMQLIFWLIAGSWSLSRTKISLRDLIRRSGETEPE